MCSDLFCPPSHHLTVDSFNALHWLMPVACRGMVESAFEFADICRKHDYHNFVFSMKASNPLVMVQAYRLLAEQMYGRGWDYPLHLGVTGEPRGLLSSLAVGCVPPAGRADVRPRLRTIRCTWALLQAVSCLIYP